MIVVVTQVWDMEMRKHRFDSGYFDNRGGKTK